MATIPSIQLFRNSKIITGRTNAIKALEGQKANVADGGLILARYSEDGTDNGVKTLLGIVRNGGGANAQLTVIDAEGAAENVQSAIEKAIENISGETASQEGKFISAITQTNGVVNVGFGGVAAANVSVADEGDIFTATTVEGVLSEIQNAIGTGGTVEAQIANAISGISGTTTITNGQVITAISQTNGIVSASTATLGADKVSASTIESSDTTVAVTGTKVSEQIASLATSIKSVSTAAKTYSIEAIIGDELTALGSNVKEAYKLVDKDGAKAGETIKIYNDSSLKSVALNGQTLNFTYILADGSESTVGVDVSTFLAESEFKNGLEVVNHVVNVKIDVHSEPFLTVGEDGIKLSGVTDAINAATTKIKLADDADKITLASATTEGGSVTYTIGQNDIASASALTAETSSRVAQDNTIEESIGLDAEGNHVQTSGNYTNGATTVVGEIAALDTKLKEVSDTLGTGVATAEGKTVTEQLQALSGTTGDASGVTSVEGAKAYAKDLVDNLDAKVVSTSGTSTTEAIEIVQTDGKLVSITLGALDCGTY